MTWLIRIVMLLLLSSTGLASQQPLTLSAALKYTLENLDDIKISDLNVVVQEGVLQTAAGPFDPTITAVPIRTFMHDVQDSGVDKKTDLDGFTNVGNLGATKTTRLGTSYAISTNDTQIFNPIFQPPPFDRLDSANITFVITQPLLRGFLYNPNAVTEAADALELDAVYLDTLQTISQFIVNTANKYWEVVAAKQILKVQEYSAKRSAELIEDIKKLIEADIAPPSDIYQPQAQHAQKVLLVIQSKQALFTAIDDLRLAMGVPAYEFRMDVEYDVDDFLDIGLPQLEAFQTALPLWFTQAIKERYDMLALHARLAEAEIELKGAYNEALPQVNVIGGVTKSNFFLGEKAKSFLSAYTAKDSETDWTCSINFSMPIYNDAAKGDIRQRRGKKWQVIYALDRLSQTIVKQIRDLATNQLSLYFQVKQAEEVVEKNKILVANEVKRVEAGYSTVFNLIDFENKLQDAHLNFILIRKQVMQNLAALRYQTNTLLSVDWGSSLIEIENLKHLP